MADAHAPGAEPTALPPPVARDHRAFATARFGYRIGPLHLLVEPGVRGEVLPAAAICEVPRAPSGIVGLINVRGEIVPVFDGPARAPTGLARSAERKVLVLHAGVHTMGLVVDGLPRTLRNLRATALGAAQLPGGIAPYVAGAYTDGATAWLEFQAIAFARDLVSASA